MANENESSNDLNSDIHLNYQNDENFDQNFQNVDDLNNSDFLDEIEAYNPSPDDFLSQNNEFHKSTPKATYLINPNKKDDTIQFRNLVVSIALILISVGILLNIIFSLLVICRTKKRQKSTLLILLSMSLAYLIFLIFYSLKISIYFYGDNITKFHMYDTIENWTYGEFMCRFVSALPACCKLLSRLSILVIVVKRLVGVFISDWFGSSFNKRKLVEQDADEESKLNDYENADLNKKLQKETLRSNQTGKSKFGKQIGSLFEWPIILILALLIWIISIVSSYPIFFSYKLKEPLSSLNTIINEQSICYSIYTFPEEIDKVSHMHLNYLLFSLFLPCLLILILLVILLIVQSVCCMGLVARSPSLTFSTSSSLPSGSPTLTKHKQNTQTTVSSSTSSFDQDSIANLARSRNNFFLWTMLFIHLGTSLPRELYKLSQLTTNFNNGEILDNYLAMRFEKSLVRARLYYAMQLLDVSEFVLMPAAFILFFLCSTKRTRPTRSESDSEFPNKRINIVESNLYKSLRNCFYDKDLLHSRSDYSTSSSTRSYLDKNKKKPIILNESAFSLNDAKVKLNSARIDALLQDNNEEKFPIPPDDGVISQSYFASMQPTPFKIAANPYFNEQLYDEPHNNNNNNNVLHIIQHPSWRINIKQQQQQPNHQLGYKDTPPTNHLPFNYVRANYYTDS